MSMETSEQPSREESKTERLVTWKDGVALCWWAGAGEEEEESERRRRRTGRRRGSRR